MLGTCVLFKGKILVLGGTKGRKNKDPSSGILIYNEAIGSWIEISNLRMGRYQCIAATLSNQELFVCGGYTERNGLVVTNDCEIARASNYSLISDNITQLKC